MGHPAGINFLTSSSPSSTSLKRLTRQIYKLIFQARRIKNGKGEEEQGLFNDIGTHTRLYKSSMTSSNVNALRKRDLHLFDQPSPLRSLFPPSKSPLMHGSHCPYYNYANKYRRCLFLDEKDFYTRQLFQN